MAIAIKRSSRLSLSIAVLFLLVLSFFGANAEQSEPLVYGEVAGSVPVGKIQSEGWQNFERDEICSEEIVTVCVRSFSLDPFIEKYFKKTASISAAAFSSDGRKLALGRMDGAVVLIDTLEERVEAIIKNHYYWISALSFTDDGSKLLSGSMDETISYWDIEKNEMIYRYDGMEETVGAFAFDEESKKVYASGIHLLIASEYPSIREIGSDHWSARFHGQQDGSYFVKLLKDKGILLSASIDGVVRQWDLESAEISRVHALHSSGIFDAAITADQKYILTASENEQARAWELETGQLYEIFRGHKEIVSGIGLSPSEKEVVTVSRDKGLRIYRLFDGALLAKFEDPETSWTKLDISPRGNFAVTLGQKESGGEHAVLWELGNADNWQKVWPSESRLQRDH